MAAQSLCCFPHWIKSIQLLLLLVVGLGHSSRLTFDCGMRELALEFASFIQPGLSSEKLQHIADALNGSPEKQAGCFVSPTKTIASQSKMPNTNVVNEIRNDDYDAMTVFVTATYQDNESKRGQNVNFHKIGTIENPFQNIHDAIQYTRSLRQQMRNENDCPFCIYPFTIILRSGIHYILKPILLNSDDSGLTIKNYQNEESIISGAVSLSANNTQCNWKQQMSNQNNNKTESSNVIYSINLANSILNNDILHHKIHALRVNNTRGIRARYPNANPSLDGFGSTLVPESYIAPNLNDTTTSQPEFEVYITSPNYLVRNTTSTGDFWYYQLGVGGICDQFLPNGGYWCGMNDKVQGGGADTYRIPKGFRFNNTILPHSPYKNLTNAVISVWHPSHWANWFFTVNNEKSNDSIIMFEKGGWQGARGNNKGKEFYIENVFEELDYPNEWFYNETESILYYINNLTNVNNISQLNSMCNLFEIPILNNLIKITGNSSTNVNEIARNIVIDGITFQDTRHTYMERHGMPSGGDWTLEKFASILIENSSNITISNSKFTRIDGNGILMYGYNRNNNVLNNVFEWLGQSAIALWGVTEGIALYDDDTNAHYTMGYDGTNGNQPQYINISYNYAREIGIFEKQSSFYFQAKSCNNFISNNIIFNGPRAGINFNDGFGGGSHVKSNLVFNMCRESGDHGPFNSWDRQVFLFKSPTNSNENTVIKDFDFIYNNFMIGNYDTQDVIDNDDGSSYYKVFSNFLLYGPNGQKSDSGGHDNWAFNNIYGYIYVHPGWDWGGPTCFHDWTNQYNTHRNRFYNNTCVLGILNDTHVSQWAKWDCTNITKPNVRDTYEIMYDNRIYSRNASLGLCGMNETTFQQTYQLDLGTKVYGYLPNDTWLLEQAKNLIFV